MPAPKLESMYRYKSFNILFSMLGFVLLCIAVQGNAIVIRHDRSDASYQVNENRYPQLFFLDYRYENKVCVGTLITEQWALTAGHCIEDTALGDSLAENTPYSLLIHGRTYLVDSVNFHPDFRSQEVDSHVDLALIKIASKVDKVKPAQLYREQDELNKVLSLVGWGFTGTGLKGLKSNDGRMRRAQNQVIEASRWLKFKFDNPDSGQTLELEGVPGLGDSGGPALFEFRGEKFVAGIAVGEIQDISAAQDSVAKEQGLYGAVEVYERVSQHLSWIDAVISN